MAIAAELDQCPAAQTEQWLVAAVDAAMVEMKNISPPLRRSECERLIRAAAECMPAPQQATPEPVGEPVAYREKLTGRLCEPEDTHRRKFPMCYEPLFTHPAPGVPEGWRNVIAGTLKTDPWDSARVADYNSGWNDCQRKTLIGLERLAAAQAKGGAKE